MKIVAISSLGPEHRFVLRRLDAAHPIAAVIRPVFSPRPTERSRGDKLMRLLRRPAQVVADRLDDWWRHRREERLDRILEQELFPSPLTAWSVPRHDIRRDQLHAPESLELIDRHQPDLMITAGSPLLRRELFERPRFGTINLHWGISPAYSGEDTLFWPLYRDDRANLGFTIHRIDQSIDRGPCLRQGRVACEPGDTEADVTIRTARMAASALIEVVSELASGRAFEEHQTVGPGHLFRRRDRKWHHDLRLWLRRRAGRASTV